MSDQDSQTLGYCLKGEIAGVEQLHPLVPGESRLGSRADNEIVVLANGVSRQHARLRLEGGVLEVQDLASKNGTFLDGQQVERARVSLGQVVRFGPVALRFQQYHHDDAELAITFEPAISDQTGKVPIVQSPLGDGLGEALPSRWLRLAEAFHARLYGTPEGDLGPALNLLHGELEIRGVYALEILAEGEPVVLAASGEIGRPVSDELRRAYEDLAVPAAPGIAFKTGSETEAPITLAVLVLPDVDPLVLALWGEFPYRLDSEPLLRLLVRMVGASRPRFEAAPEASGTSEYPGLDFPPGYVRAQSAQMVKIYSLMQTLAQGDLPILIVGETGAGKEYLAHILHRSSTRRRGPFIAINCAAIPAELLEAELFGIGEGVATGVSGKEGRLQLASGGTLFLDEIGDMSADLQAKLLRALQEKEVHPVGRAPVAVDVRVLAATNQDLSKHIESGAFRADLYYRLAGYVLEIPPLAQRPDDIPALVEHFLRNCAKELGRPVRGLTVRALRLLCRYPWPGNVRELANEVRRAVYLCPENRTVDSSTLSRTILDYRPEKRPAAETGDGGANAPTDQDLPAPMGLGFDSLNLEQLERQATEEALRRCRHNQVQAAKLLGISRQSLRRRLERWGKLKAPDDRIRSA